MKVIFAGSGDIGLPTLQWLIDRPGIDLTGVVCQPDKPSGRKQELTPPRTKALAVSHGIPVHQPVRLKNEFEFFTSANPDLVVVIAYGQILPKAVLDSPRIACLNLHASILPKFRGASPIQAAIREGESTSGITVMYMDEGLDTGDILLSEEIPLATDETGGSLHDRLANLAPAALERALDQLRKHAAPRIPQDPNAATHCRKLGRHDGIIDWNESAATIERLIRAYAPWPGTSTWLHSVDNVAPRMLKIFPPVEIVSPYDAAMHGDSSAPGNLMHTNDTEILVHTGNGALRLLEIQLEGKKRMPVETFLNGNALPTGAYLGTK